MSDGPALWRHLPAEGALHELLPGGLDSMGIAESSNIFDNGTDIDLGFNALYAAAWGKFVNLEKGDFVGRDALANADRTLRLEGLFARPLHQNGASRWRAMVSKRVSLPRLHGRPNWTAALGSPNCAPEPWTKASGK